MSDLQQFEPDWFSKPGDSLRALMQRRGVAASDLAAEIEGGMPVVRGLIDGSIDIDYSRAETLAALLGGTAQFWICRQSRYEEAVERATDAALAKEAEGWLARVPMPDGKRRNSSNLRTARSEIKRRLVYYSVPNLKTWELRYGRMLDHTLFRTSTTFQSTDDAVLLWLRQGELESELVSTKAWSSDVLAERMSSIVKLSKISQPSRFLPMLKKICAEAGVAFVVVKAPQGCRASGASRLVAPDKAMILVSFRYRSDDHFWFTVFHEIGHLLLHGARLFIDEETTPEDDCEQEANDFSRACIIPEGRMGEFRSLQANRDAVMRFAVSLGVSPGLVIGQMQHHGIIEHRQLNALKRRWTWADIGDDAFSQ